MILKSWDDKIWTRYMLGMVQRDAGKYAACAETFSRIVNESPNRRLNQWSNLQVGLAYKKLGEYGKSRNEFEKLLSEIKQDSGSLEVHLDLSEKYS